MIELAPGIHAGIKFSDYAAQHALNAGVLNVLLNRCPAAAFFNSFLNPERPPQTSSATMDAGTIAHECLLEGSCERVVVVDPFKFPAKTTGAVPEGWTNQAIRAERDRIVGLGKIPMFAAAYEEVERMVQAARDFLASVRHDEPGIFAAFEAGGGESELTMVWDDGGTRCKIRPDRINTARTLIVDYKTGDTSAEPNQWGRTQMMRMGYYTAAAFYRRGVKALTGHAPEYVFLVQEREPPYLCSLVGVDEPAFALGAEKVEYALNLWTKCARSRTWPAYPSRVCFPELPPWEQARWQEHEAVAVPDHSGKSWDDHMRDERAPAV